MASLRKNVLIVEDSRATRELIASAVEAIEGAVAVEVGSGLEAIRVLAREKFELILTDVNMPDINGLELVRFIRQNERHNDVPLVIISSERSQIDRDRGLKLGATDYLVKPFDPDALSELVRRYLNK